MCKSSSELRFEGNFAEGDMEVNAKLQKKRDKITVYAFFAFENNCVSSDHYRSYLAHELLIVNIMHMLSPSANFSPRTLLSILTLLLGFAIGTQAQPLSAVSPDKKVKLSFGIDSQGAPWYKVTFGKKQIIKKSALGMRAKGYDMKDGFRITGRSLKSANSTWQPVWGEVANIKDQYNELKVELTNAQNRKMQIVFRVHDDGVGFRYEFLGTGEMAVTDEITEFALTTDNTAWWIPGDWDSNEHRYTQSKVSQIDGAPYQKDNRIFTQNIVDEKSVQTPLTMRTPNGNVHMSIVEAGLKDFAALHLTTDTKNHKLTAALIPSAEAGVKSRNKLPFATPWRGIILSKDAAGILESKLILNLNDPCTMTDVSWIKPQKYVGIWWLMHVGRATWDYAAGQDMNTATNRAPHGRHGATTENTKMYIDFAAKHGFDGVLVEGWNVGWEDWFGKQIDSVFSFVTPYPDYNIDELSAYAKERGVRIIMHHETSSSVTNYESQMEDAYLFMKKHNMNSAKTGYVGKIIPRGEMHDGQWMVKHYVRVAAAMAKHQLMVDMHEPVRPSGLHRTYPNWMACEAARGTEFEAWSVGNPPDHTTIMPFTRLLGGPMDYTPGIFETRMNAYDPKKKEVIHTTVAKQLALYVTMYSPLQMAADLPENYEKRLDVFQFIKDVPVDWSDTKILEAEIGDFLTIARKKKASNDWFIGSITDELDRATTLKMDFLDAGYTYEAIIYEDGPDAHWEKNPYPVNIRKVTVRKGDKIDLKLAAGGGTAISVVRK
jgi:glucan 1,4-alpha-glucosidase